MKRMQLNLKKQIIIFTLICIIASFIASAFSNVTIAAETDTSGKKIAEASTASYGSSATGDQGHEVQIANYRNGFTQFYRYSGDKENEVRNAIAESACNAANNQMIGYTYGAGTTFMEDMKLDTYSHDPKNINQAIDTDCSHFVCACIISAGYKVGTKAKELKELKNCGYYATSSIMNGDLTNIGFKKISGTLEKGDILARDGHTAIYVGDAAAIASGSSPYLSNTRGVTLTAEQINEYYKDAVDLDSQDFKYNGLPKKVGIVQKKSLSEIIDAIKNIVNYIFGILVSGIRMAVVGFTEEIESLINGLLLSAEGITDSKEQAKQPEYSIEDLLYNRIPALDVNIFSNTPGGKQLVKDSVLDTVKKLVAGWYYSIRNIAAVIMFIILLYTGLRMAISTSAESKANYSEQLVTWIKCMVLLFVIHYLMIFILTLNDILVKMFAATTTGIGSLHDTIEARAYDMRFTVGISGMIMYVTLIVYWIKFLLLYIRRYIYNIIYIILAPFAIIRYAMDNANTKGKAGFENWLNKFVANIIIQPAHALAYTLFMSIAVKLALESIGGFIIALVFMSQILKMDEYVLSIVRFKGSDASNHLRKMKKPMKEEWPIVAYGQMKILGRTAKNIGTIGAGIARPIGNYAKYRNYQNNKPGIIAGKLNKHDQKSIDNALERINKMKNTVENEKANNPELAESLNRKIAKEQQKIENMKIKINARNNNAEAKKILKLKRDNRKQVFKASAGAIKNVLGTVAGATLAIPLAVAESPEAGIVAAKMIKSPGNHISNYQKIVKKQNKINEKQDKIQNTIALVNKASEITDSIETSINKIKTSDNIEDIRAELKKVDKLNANSENIKNLVVNEQIKDQDVSVQTSIKNVLYKMDKNKVLTEIQKEDLAQRESQDIKSNYGLDSDDKISKIDDDNDITDLSNKVSDDVTKEIVSPENIEIAKKINELKDLNDKSKEENNGADIKVININKFIDNLGTTNNSTNSRKNKNNYI